MKIYIDVDEYYPYYDAYNESQGWNSADGEISDDEWKDYCRVMDEHRVWQNRLRKLTDEFKRKKLDNLPRKQLNAPVAF